jgi:NAD(P)-dependent dehydrogenase (short-subunit alcohol dehydrogenase family)
MAMSASAGRLDGRVAIVTAAGQGIGEGIARAYAREGAKLVVTGRTMSKLEAVAAQIGALGGEIRCLQAHAGNRADAERTVAEAISTYGRLDILVNNAHTFTDKMPVEDPALEEHIRINMDTAVIGSLQLMQCAFPHMRDSGGGSIINLGSSFGYRCEWGYTAYAASKEAIRALTKTAAREWGKYKIRVNTLLPSALSPKAREYLRASGTYDLEVAKTALGYIGAAEVDVAPVAVFLASDDSHYVTGQSICADGGSLMH